MNDKPFMSLLKNERNSINILKYEYTYILQMYKTVIFKYWSQCFLNVLLGLSELSSNIIWH